MNRALCLIYLAVTVWLALCTALTYGTVPAWATVTMTAATLTLIIAIRKETDLRNAREHINNLEELKRREEHRRNGRPLNQVEQAVFQRLAASVELPGPDEPRGAA